MLNHVLGRGHREKYLMKKFDINPANPPKESWLRNMAEKSPENDNPDLIDTIYSDEMYPWPSGKAPWSLEQGGTGHPPTYGRSGQIYARVKKDPDAGSRSPGTRGVSHDVTFNVKGLPSLLDAKALDAHYESMLNILKRAMTFHKSNAIDQDSAQDVSVLNGLIETNIQLLRGIKLQENMYKATPIPFSSMPSIQRNNRSPSPFSRRDYRNPSPTGSTYSIRSPRASTSRDYSRSYSRDSPSRRSRSPSRRSRSPSRRRSPHRRY